VLQWFGGQLGSIMSTGTNNQRRVAVNRGVVPSLDDITT